MHDDHQHDHDHDHDHDDCCSHSAGEGGHVHTHTHDGHTHSHEHADDSYYIDQLCMVGLSGAFGAICLSLYFWQRWMLNNLLGQQFHIAILASGVALVVIALVRGYALWNKAGKATAAEQASAAEHLHAHEHGHTHSH